MLFKPSCLLCLDKCNTSLPLCDDCLRVLPHAKTACKRCASPLNNQGNLCGKCLANPPHFDRTISLFSYQTPIAQLIKQLKFHQNLMIARMLGKLWIRFSKVHETTLPECILPVPLHHTRLKERGFNQALQIAKPISKYFKIPIDTRTCIRIRNTPAQSSLPAKKRVNNLRHAFALSYQLPYKHIAILDDVMTTGSTINEIAGLLKKQGVKRIDALCCARASNLD